MQNPEIVVVSKPSGPEGPVRTGELLAKDKGVLTVRWEDDGSEEDVRISATTTFMPRGSLRHEAFADPGRFAERLRQDAVGVFAQVLREGGGRQRAADLKKQLVELGLDSGTVDKAWRRAQKRLGELEEVTETNNAFRWRPVRRPEPEPKPEPAAPISADTDGDLAEDEERPSGEDSRESAKRWASELAQAPDRQKLAQLLALPDELIAHLPPEQVAAAFRRLSRTDPHVAAWLAALEKDTPHD